MNAKKLSAVLTAALLAGALSTTAFAADRLPTGCPPAMPASPLKRLLI